MKLKKGVKKKLFGKTKVVVEKDLNDGNVLVDIEGAWRIVRKSNLK